MPTLDDVRRAALAALRPPAAIPRRSPIIGWTARQTAFRGWGEFAFGAHRDGLTAAGPTPSRKIITGVNWSPGINNPFRQLGQSGEGMDAVLTKARVNASKPVIIALHVACPRVAYTDRGKSAIVVEGDVREGDDGEEE
jgi:hypothetical protein